MVSVRKRKISSETDGIPKLVNLDRLSTTELVDTTMEVELLVGRPSLLKVIGWSLSFAYLKNKLFNLWKPIEGAVDQDGRLPSIWDTFSEEHDLVTGGHSWSVATDHYNRYEEDVKIMKEMGLDAYRFSISWSRILPSTGIRPAPKRARVSSSSDKNLEVEIVQIREEAEEERNRHKEELEQVFNISKEYVNEMLRRARLSIPDDVIDTSIQP
ncbi:hypothetical protein LguiA_000389 [Lonicera macranthoides]